MSHRVIISPPCALPRPLAWQGATRSPTTNAPSAVLRMKNGPRWSRKGLERKIGSKPGGGSASDREDMGDVIGHLSLQHLSIGALHIDGTGGMDERGVAGDQAVEALPRLGEVLPVDAGAPGRLLALHVRRRHEDRAGRAGQVIAQVRAMREAGGDAGAQAGQMLVN